MKASALFLAILLATDLMAIPKTFSRKAKAIRELTIEQLDIARQLTHTQVKALQLVAENRANLLSRKQFQAVGKLTSEQLDVAKEMTSLQLGLLWELNDTDVELIRELSNTQVYVLGKLLDEHIDLVEDITDMQWQAIRKILENEES